ncbi:MAG TPA: hypothetical protein PK586_14025 [Casimicrobium sp.]|nr:hypothetical protein [Casimicrobium sp.]
MNVMDLVGSSYNYYPKTAVALCVISYSDTGSIAAQVSQQTDVSVVWGPAECVSKITGVPYSLMYVAAKASTGEYYVVIRGTDFLSLSTWLLQDFDVDASQPLGNLQGKPKSIPATALVSQGTFNGMSDLLDLSDPTTGLSLVQFLVKSKPSYLFVTGHSLGGTLTPPMFAYLNATVYNGGTISNMALWSFAGLTPGGTGFNQYFNSIIPNNQGFPWRIQNSLDIAPLMWWSQSGVQKIYASNGLSWGFPESDLIKDLFSDAASAKIGYAQPQPGLLLPGTFDNSIIDSNIWAAQALQQHHSTTYQAMVNAKYR